MNLKGKNQKGIRIDNLMQALRIIIFQGPCSRKELAQQLGLSKMCITNIVNEFLNNGLVSEVEAGANQPITSGPKPLLLKVVPGKILVVGIHITEHFINGQIYDVAEDVVCEKKISTETIRSKAQFISSMKDIVDELMGYAKDKKVHIIGIGVTDNYFINREAGSLSFKGNQLGIDTEFIKNNLEQRYQLPVYIENEQMGLLLTELAYGLYDSKKKKYFLSISDEIRGAFTCEYFIQKGCLGLSGMVGHMSIKCDGPKCSCGNRGCYSQYGSISVLLRDSSCASIAELNSNLEHRDPLALRALENFIQATTIALTNIANLYDPETIVVMGKVLELDASVLKKIEYLINDSFYFHKQRTISIVPSTLNEEHYKRGASILALYKIVSNNDFSYFLSNKDN